MSGRELLIALAIIYNGDYDSILSAVSHRVEIDENEVKTLTHDVDCVTMLDEDYPQVLKHTPRAPLVLFYKGDKTLLHSPKIDAFIGTRVPNGETEIFTDEFVRRLPQEHVVITGLSVGVAATATLSALESKHKVIAVLGSGFNNLYPQCNRDLYDRIIAEGGLVITEYPADSHPEAMHFPMRNRVIAALANNVCCMESRARSGAVVTVNYALQYGKNVFAKANYLDADDFNNQLLNEGCSCLTFATTL